VKYNKPIEFASKARAKAYAPYLKFAVGAVFLTESRKFLTGCNIESVLLGLTIWAERWAVAAVSQGSRDFIAVAVVADPAEPAVPCGACRQVLAEFSPGLTMISSTTNGRVQEFKLNELLPLPTQGVLEAMRNV
jgi:cytidine deaminase